MALESLSRIDGLRPVRSSQDGRQRGGQPRRDSGASHRSSGADVVELSGEPVPQEDLPAAASGKLPWSRVMQAALRAYGSYRSPEERGEER